MTSSWTKKSLYYDFGEDRGGEISTEILQLESGLEDDISKNELDLEKMESNLCAAEGISKPSTMKLMGTIQGCKVKVLVDNEARLVIISLAPKLSSFWIKQHLVMTYILLSWGWRCETYTGLL